MQSQISDFYRKLILKVQEDKKYRKEFFNKLTGQAPVIIYVLEIKPDGRVLFPFVSRSLNMLYPNITADMLEKDGNLLYRQVHPEDKPKFRAATKNSKKNLSDWEVKYRVLCGDGSIKWHWSKARPEKKEDGTLVYYGVTMDVTESQEYIQIIEDILFDISHVMRRP